jgi:hypothetical protein
MVTKLLKNRFSKVFVAIVIAASMALTPSAGHARAQDDPRPEPFTHQHLNGLGSIGDAEATTTNITLTVPINLVFIGYSDQQVNREALMDQLPATYDPVVRVPRFYGLPGRDMGLHYRFAYRTINATQHFEDQFFHRLAALGTPGNLTYYQQLYNDQQHNVLDVTGPVLYIDAPSVEAWLASNARSLGVDVADSYTIFFINWYNRPDFRFHVYTKTDEPDPDTGFNFGAIRDSRKMIGWGGTTSRTWFYDLSAGPDWNTVNWEVDHPDLDGDGHVDYRMPPIWEYTAGGFRDPSQLGADLGLVTRYVGIDMLFTPSPLYDPINTRPRLGGSKVVSVNMLEDDPASSGLSLINANKARAELSALEPYYRFDVNVQDHQPIETGAQHAFRIWTGLLSDNDCWNAYGTPFAELFCYFDSHLSQYPTPHNPRDYVINNFAFNTTDANMDQWLGLLGFADDNWRDGTQSYNYVFDYNYTKDLGYGFTSSTIHETGHHLGLSHPHDGYDPETDVDFVPDGPFFFAWTGDESNTVMSYMDLTTRFGVFNRDNMARWEVAGLLHDGDQLLGQLKTHKDAANETALMSRYTSARDTALVKLQGWDFEGAALSAVDGYGELEKAATDLGVAILAPAVSTAPVQAIPHQVDPVRPLGPGH